MDVSILQHLAAGNAWGAIWPELALGCLALALLVLEIALPREAHRHIPSIAILGQIAVLLALLLGFRGDNFGRESFNGLLVQSGPGQAMRIFFIVSAILVCLLARVSLARQAMPRVEFYNIVLVVTAAMMLLALAGIDDVADLVARAGGFYKREPVATGLGALLGDDFDDVAIAQLVFQWHHAGVDFGAGAAMADVGMNGVGEVDRSGLARQHHDLPFGREAVDLLGVQVDLEAGHEVGGIAGLALPLDELDRKSVV